MMLVELNRMSSHLLFQATNGMDIGAVSMMLYGWREREEVLRFLESVTGLRMNHNFIRPGGVAADLPDGWQERDLDELCDVGRARACAEYDELLLARTRSGVERTVGVGADHHRGGLARSITGPILRSTGFAWDLRKAQPYLAYDEVDFDVVYGAQRRLFDRLPHPARRDPRVGQDRAPVRGAACPAGDYRVQDKKVTPPPRARIDESMEALIHHFKLFTEGFRVPAGETYVAIESPRGEIGCYIVSDGIREAGAHAHPRPVLLQPAGDRADGHRQPRRRRGRDRVEHRPDHGRGRTADGFFTDAEPPRARRRSSAGTRTRSRRSCRSLHLAQDQDGWLTARGDGARSRSSPA